MGALLGCWLSGVLTSCEPEPTADVLLFNGHFTTLDSLYPSVNALAISEGRILALGDPDELREQYRFAREQDLEGQWVYPGFIDAHCHVVAFAKSLRTVDLTNARSEVEAIELLVQKVREFDSASGSIDVVEGWGWDNTRWPGGSLPVSEQLNTAFPHREVRLRRVDGHALWVNQAVLDRYEIGPGTVVEGGEIRWCTGGSGAVLIDRAQDLVPEVEWTVDALSTALIDAEQRLLASGLTGLNDAGLDTAQLFLLRRLYRKGRLHIPLNAMASDDSASFAYFLEHGPIEEDRFRVRSFKFYADGALGSHGALLLEPYTDRPEHQGLSLRRRAFLKTRFAQLKEAGFQVCTHAIGDSANRQVLRLYAELLGDGGNPRRWRIEHAQVVHPWDWALFGKHRILPSVQPTHAVSDADWVLERLGTERLERAYAYRSLWEQNKRLPLGTDFPIESIDPLRTFRAAVFRSDSPEGRHPSLTAGEALSPEQALRGMTLDAAYAQYRDTQTGSLSVGKYADLVVLDVDLLHCTLEESLRTRVLQTWLRGVKAYDHRSAAPSKPTHQ